MAKNKRIQASKRARAMQNGNVDMRDAFIELRKGSRAQPHRNRARYSRNDWRREAQAGF